MYIHDSLNPFAQYYIYLNTANNISFGVIRSLHEEEVICMSQYNNYKMRH